MTQEELFQGEGCAVDLVQTHAALSQHIQSGPRCAKGSIGAYIRLCPEPCYVLLTRLSDKTKCFFTVSLYTTDDPAREFAYILPGYRHETQIRAATIDLIAEGLGFPHSNVCAIVSRRFQDLQGMWVSGATDK